jgi:D-alanyl-D-alanine carboxypeptidase
MEIYQGMDGLKTGYIRASGFNLAASAVRDGRRLIAIVMGGDTPGWRDEHMAELMDQGFATPRTPAPMVASLQAPALPTRKPETGIEVASIEELSDGDQIAALTANLAPTSASLTSSAAAAEAPKAAEWGIQVGAFSDPDAGRRALADVARRMPTLLASAYPQMLPITTGSGRLFRARLMGLDESMARTVCGSLARTGEDCLTVAP